jgi:hypothetical protein
MIKIDWPWLEIQIDWFDLAGAAICVGTVAWVFWFIHTDMRRTCQRDCVLSGEKFVECRKICK